jgi:hypothetical protein
MLRFETLRCHDSVFAELRRSSIYSARQGIRLAARVGLQFCGKSPSANTSEKKRFAAAQHRIFRRNLLLLRRRFMTQLEMTNFNGIISDAERTQSSIYPWWNSTLLFEAVRFAWTPVGALQPRAAAGSFSRLASVGPPKRWGRYTPDGAHQGSSSVRLRWPEG